MIPRPSPVSLASPQLLEYRFPSDIQGFGRKTLDVCQQGTVVCVNVIVKQATLFIQAVSSILRTPFALFGGDQAPQMDEL